MIVQKESETCDSPRNISSPSSFHPPSSDQKPCPASTHLVMRQDCNSRELYSVNRQNASCTFQPQKKRSTTRQFKARHHRNYLASTRLETESKNKRWLWFTIWTFLLITLHWIREGVAISGFVDWVKWTCFNNPHSYVITSPPTLQLIRKIFFYCIEL